MKKSKIRNFISTLSVFSILASAILSVPTYAKAAFDDTPNWEEEMNQMGSIGAVPLRSIAPTLEFRALFEQPKKVEKRLPKSLAKHERVGEVAAQREVSTPHMRTEDEISFDSMVTQRQLKHVPSSFSSSSSSEQLSDSDNSSSSFSAR